VNTTVASRLGRSNDEQRETTVLHSRGRCLAEGPRETERREGKGETACKLPERVRDTVTQLDCKSRRLCVYTLAWANKQRPNKVGVC
jgi:hypothetical protein